MKRQTLQNIMIWVLKTITRTEYLGVDLVPPAGPVLIATNHLSRADIGVLFGNPARPDLTALVTTKYLNYGFIKWFCSTAGAIWIDREHADFGAFRLATEALKQGRAVGISPEGTRSSQTHALLEGKPGTILLAVKNKAPIVPVALSGTENAFQELFRFRKPRMTVRFGKPFYVDPEVDPLTGKHVSGHHSEMLKRWTDETMCRIAALLPEKYRGFYKDFPRVKELEKIK